MNATQLDMFRASDPETSREAARLTNRSGGMGRVLSFLRAVPTSAYTDHEISEHTGLPLGSASKRRGDLTGLGLVEFSGYFGVTPFGARARRWKLTDAGRQA